jgi:hypothetical protein
LRPGIPLLSLIVLLILVSPALADYCGGLLDLEIVSHAGEKYLLERGTETVLHEEGNPVPTRMTFVGRTIGPTEETREFAFYDWKEKRLHLIEAQKIRIRTLSTDGDAIAEGEIAPVVRSRNQAGGTCAAYALYNCFHQLRAIRSGNENLGKIFATEETRNGFQADLVHELYKKSENSANLDQILREHAAKFGFQVRETKGAGLSASVVHDLEMGYPVVIRFDCGPEACNMPVEYLDHRTQSKLSSTMWQPNPVREKSAAGHAVLLSGIFRSGGVDSIIVTDSNFEAPRLWPVTNLDMHFSADLRAWTLFE